MKILETHIAKPQSLPIRIQEYAVGIFETANTKSAIKKAIKKELLLVNDKPTTTARIIVGGEKLAFLAAGIQSTQKTYKINLQVIYEDDHLAVIEKPAGLLVSGNVFKSIDNALAHNLTVSKQRDAVRPRPVHRLDFATTGLLLIGKSSSSIQKLNQLFENKEVQKIYYAITIGKIESEGSIEFSIDGKSAKTSFKKIETVDSKRFNLLNLVQLSPATGRRHQLRKHLLELDSPILGDKKYGKEGLILNGKGLYLHAYKLSFVHPFTNEPLVIQSPLPVRFQKIFPKANIN